MSDTPIFNADAEPNEAELPFQTLANSIPQLCWIADESGHIFWYNRRWFEFTGTDLDQMLGWGWREVHHPDHIEAVIERWTVALKAQLPWEDTFPLLGADGEWKWFLSRATPVRSENGAIVRWFGTNTDITREREIAAALEDSRARSEAILETALDCIIVIDHQSRITEWNPAAENTFGHRRDAVIGQHLPEVIIPLALREAHHQGLQKYLSTGIGPVLGRRIELPALHADGHEFPVELAITRISGDGPPAFSAYLRDISARKEAEQSLAAHAKLAVLGAEIGLALNKADSLRAILGSCAIAITAHLDALFTRIWTLNDLENCLELQASAGLYTHLDGAHSKIPVGAFKIGRIAQSRLPHLTNQVVGDLEVADQEWAAREALQSFAGYPLLVEGRLMGVLGLFSRHALSDDTLRTLATVADALSLGILRKSAEAELERAKLAAEDASRTKSLFLANMSHELRTPLNAILGYSEMLEEEANEQGLADFAPDLEKINTAGKHLLALINDILDLSKIEAGKMELYLETFEARALVEEVAAATRPAMQKSGCEFRVEIEDSVGAMRADSTKVRQCLFNLLSNAAKFTKNGQVTLRASRQRIASLDFGASDAQGRDWLVFEVSDTGIGMSGEQVLRLFQAFTQADASTTRQFGGTGLGLALTRRFCQMMGGDIVVHSELGVGSTFTCKIPALVGETDTLDSAPIVAPDALEFGVANGVFAPGTAVLVIDDDLSQLELMRRFLQREGFAVQVARSGEEGLRMARQNRPLAITLDVMMAGMDGWSTLGALKADADLSDVPVVMLTMVDDKNRGYALGAADYATKPVDRARLKQILQKYVCATPPCPVLLVEDDAPTRQMMRQMLEREGWAVEEAENGREALQKVEKSAPQLILLDLMMPEMDGFDFATTLHQNPAHRGIPIVVLTARDVSETDRQRLSGNVQKVLQKTGKSRDELLQQVRELVAGAVPRVIADRVIADREN